MPAKIIPIKKQPLIPTWLIGVLLLGGLIGFKSCNSSNGNFQYNSVAKK